MVMVTVTELKGFANPPFFITRFSKDFNIFCFFMRLELGRVSHFHTQLKTKAVRFVMRWPSGWRLKDEASKKKINK
jgi:hypothetical protein